MGKTKICLKYPWVRREGGIIRELSIRESLLEDITDVTDF
jgi:hypothetical protein